MAFTPSKMRHMPTKPSPQFRLSPAGHKSPTRNSRDDQTLSLKQIIGITTTSSNGFDSLEAARCFAYVAGAAAVLSTLDEKGLPVCQRYFRARPSAEPLNLQAPLYDPPTPLGPKPRAAAGPRDSYAGSALFGSPGYDSGLDSPSNKTTSMRERTKAATCVSLSPDGKLLAVGETGHKPRVLIFSTAKDVPTDVPLTILSDHTFGVRCVAFSADSQYLASLGDINDGFLYIWAIDHRTGSATLHASNKCTSQIRQIAWLGSNLVTVGTRHVKIWRIEDGTQSPSPSKRFNEANYLNPSTRALFGRNCLLGPLLDQTFSAVTPIMSNKAIVTSDQGDICLLDDGDISPRFFKVADAGFSINTAILSLTKFVIVGGHNGQMKCFEVEDLSTCIPSLERAMCDGKLMASGHEQKHIIAMAPLNDQLVTLDSKCTIGILSLGHNFGGTRTCSLAHQFPAHAAAVLGVQSFSLPNDLDVAFVTWCADGLVLLWNSAGICAKAVNVQLDQLNCGEEGLMNELRVIQVLESSECLVSGDRFGIIRVIEISTGKTVFNTRAHSGEITGITAYEKDDPTFIATCARDRMVQLFQKRADGFVLLHTMDEHVGAVTGVMFTMDGNHLISCSSDRTIVVREAITGDLNGRATTAYLMRRTITLKATPLSMETSPDHSGIILVSTIDKHVLKYDLQSGSLRSSFRVSDLDNGDSVIMSSVIHVPVNRHSSAIAGVSGTDKSIRLYHDTGRLMGREYGHTERMSGITLINSGTDGEKKSLVTVATDGTIFIWTFVSAAEQQEMLESREASGGIPVSNVYLTSRPPLRRVLSTSELEYLQGLREDEQSKRSSALISAIQSPRRKPSRLSLVRTPKLDPSPILSNRRTTNSSDSTVTMAQPRNRRVTTGRPASPPNSQRPSQTTNVRSRVSSIAAPRVRRKSMIGGLAPPTAEFGSLAVSTEQICRSLHDYRKKLSSTSDALPLENVRELERELSSTARVLAEKASRNETAMVKLLDRYSERLVSMLDERIADSVAREVRRNVGRDEEGSG